MKFWIRLLKVMAAIGVEKCEYYVNDGRRRVKMVKMMMKRTARMMLMMVMIKDV